MKHFDIGVIGLGVMGANLALNLRDHGFAVAGYDADPKRLAGCAAEHTANAACETVAALVERLKSPRRILVMVPAGPAVDDVIAGLLPHLSAGDVVVDGGNSYFKDTERRAAECAKSGVHFFGMGVSGGEEGARRGPALMPGGAREGWAALQPMFEAIAAKADDGTPCCAYCGPGGAGHYVKMVHNGIEYADMQLIAEAYWLLRSIGGMEPAAQAQVFRDWNAGDLQSYLIEITANILEYTDAETGAPMVDVILDAAGQKGTGSWTSQNALELGAPAPTIAEAVFARCISAIKGARLDAAHALDGPELHDGDMDVAQLVADVEQALYASKIAVYAQGFQLLRYASAEYQWHLDFGAIAGTWRAGCIIRARLLEAIRAAYAEQPDLANLMTEEPFRGKLHGAQSAWRRVVCMAAEHGVPAPGFMSALSYYDSYRSATLPANLIQAQRDYFGAHTYERADRPRGEFFHTDWTAT